MSNIPFEKSFASHEKSACWSEKNELKPCNVYKSTATKYWFQCNECNHEFDAALSNVNLGRWCPFCGNNKLCSNIGCTICQNKSFASHEKALQWSYTKNTKVPRDVFRSSGIKHWFDCQVCNHSFEIGLSSVSSGKWCPYCSSQRLCNNECERCFNKSFASNEQSKFWSSKNDKSPREVFRSSNNKHWFDCPNCNHSFDTTLCHRNEGNDCPYCSSQRLCNNKNCEPCNIKSFNSHEKSAFWSKINDVTPRDVFKSTHGKYWFDCPDCNHSFDAALSHINEGNWCPYCGNQRLCSNKECEPCSIKSFASNDKSVFWSALNKLTPRDVFRSSGAKYLFDCSECKHSFGMALSHITRGNWCSYCSNPPKLICNNCECEPCYNKSFASHEKALYWSSKNDKTSRDVFKSSGDKYWFDCPECKHSFSTTLGHVSLGQWCPYCSIPSKLLCSDEKCEHCHDKSFASHDKSCFWSKRNELTPRDVFKSSGDKYWFDCQECKHEFDMVLNHITRGSWCPYCCNPSKLICSNDCEHCFNKSFASHEKSCLWSCKNELMPRDVFKSSRAKYLFDCVECETTFQISLYSVIAGSWCPLCKNKTEGKLFKQLKEMYPSLETQFKRDWCKNIQHLLFDFCIPEFNIIIELDGRQHFDQVSNWSSPEEQFTNDKYKEKCANENGYSVIRILQEDVFYDRYDWFTELCASIEELASSGTITNKYLCKKGEYDGYT